MSEFRVGQRVQLYGKNLRGRIAFVGVTHFSTGLWIGVVLEVPRGRNNGSVRGYSYFQCEPYYGLFVRPTQLRALPELEQRSSCGGAEALATSDRTHAAVTAVEEDAVAITTTTITASKATRKPTTTLVTKATVGATFSTATANENLTATAATLASKTLTERATFAVGTKSAASFTTSTAAATKTAASITTASIKTAASFTATTDMLQTANIATAAITRATATSSVEPTQRLESATTSTAALAIDAATKVMPSRSTTARVITSRAISTTPRAITSNTITTAAIATTTEAATVDLEAATAAITASTADLKTNYASRATTASKTASLRPTTAYATANSTVASLLKTTKISAPKEVKHFLSASSQQLFLSPATMAAAANALSARSATAAVLSLPPKRSKTVLSPTESFCCAKRASFVETGFLEILQPQFTPGQPQRSPSVSLLAAAKEAIMSKETKESKQNSEVMIAKEEVKMQHTAEEKKSNEAKEFKKQQKADEMKHEEQRAKYAKLANDSQEQLRQLQEQLEQQQLLVRQQQTQLTLLKDENTQLRASDKRQLHELHHLRLQHEQLQEFKTQIMEQHGTLQRELQRSRQETRDANEARARALREIAELSDSIELLTLDKEMAEERAETLQLELEIASERVEELTLDVEILQAESEQNVLPPTTDDKQGTELRANAGQLRKLELHNQRLKQTVIGLRDVLTLEKQALQRALKAFETQCSANAELQTTKQLLSQRIDVLEAQAIELKEQVDAALGAEHMVQTLADAKLDLEERVRLLEEEVAELEALEQIHEQIIESSQELEQELRSEYDAQARSVRAAQQERNAALETLYDRELTIQKFREQVRQLTERAQHCDALLDDLNTLSSSVATTTTTPPSLDYQQVFALTKACGREIDAQLLQLQLRLAQQQLAYLLAFMPPQFQQRGGDYDVLLVLLALQRLQQKLHIIAGHVSEKFAPSCDLDERDNIYERHAVQRAAFRAKSLFLLRALQALLQQLLSCLQHADYALCQQAAAYGGELAKHEQQHVDALLQLLRGGELDEHTSTAPLEATLAFMQLLHSHLSAELDDGDCEWADTPTLYASLCDCYDAAVECIDINAALLLRLISDAQHLDAYALLQRITQQMLAYKQRVRAQRKRLTHCNLQVGGGLPQQQQQCMKATNEALVQFVNILSASAREAIRCISNDAVATAYSTIEDARLWQLLSNNCMLFNAAAPALMLNDVCALLDAQFDAMDAFVDAQHAANISNRNTVCVRTSTHALLLRAAAVREQCEQYAQLERKLDARDQELKTLKYVMKMKQTEFSELQLRKEMAERNHTRLMTEQTAAVGVLHEQAEQLLQHFACGAALMLRSVEQLRGKLFGMEQQVAQLQAHLRSSTTHSTLSRQHSDADTVLLTLALRQQHKQRIRVQADTLKRKLQQLVPIQLPRQTPDLTLSKCEAERQQLKNAWILSHLQLRATANCEKLRVQRKSNELATYVLLEYFRRHPHRAAPSDFGVFFAKDMSQILWQ